MKFITAISKWWTKFWEDYNADMELLRKENPQAYERMVREMMNRNLKS